MSARPLPESMARQQLVHLRAQILQLAHEVEAACDGITGKGAPRARASVSDLARRMRDIAMNPNAVKASRL